MDVVNQEDATIERCKELIVVYEPQTEMKKAEKMSLIGVYTLTHIQIIISETVRCYHDNIVQERPSVLYCS